MSGPYRRTVHLDRIKPWALDQNLHRRQIDIALPDRKFVSRGKTRSRGKVHIDDVAAVLDRTVPRVILQSGVQVNLLAGRVVVQIPVLLIPADQIDEIDQQHIILHAADTQRSHLLERHASTQDSGLLGGQRLVRHPQQYAAGRFYGRFDGDFTVAGSIRNLIRFAVERIHAYDIFAVQRHFDRRRFIKRYIGQQQYLTVSELLAVMVQVAPRHGDKTDVVVAEIRFDKFGCTYRKSRFGCGSI